MSKCNILFKFTIIFLGTCSIYANPEVAVHNQQPIQTIPNIVPKQNNNNNTVLVNNNQVSNNNINQRVNNNKIAQPNKKLVVYNRAMNNKEFINRLNKEYRSKNLIYKANEQILKNIKKLPPNPIPYKERKEKEMKELQQSIETDNINAIKSNNPTEYKQFVNHLTDVSASYNTNVSNNSEVAMANQKLLAQQNKIQVSPETKVLQFTEQ